MLSKIRQVLSVFPTRSLRFIGQYNINLREYKVQEFSAVATHFVEKRKVLFTEKYIKSAIIRRVPPFPDMVSNLSLKELATLMGDEKINNLRKEVAKAIGENSIIIFEGGESLLPGNIEVPDFIDRDNLLPTLPFQLYMLSFFKIAGLPLWSGDVSKEEVVTHIRASNNRPADNLVEKYHTDYGEAECPPKLTALCVINNDSKIGTQFISKAALLEKFTDKEIEYLSRKDCFYYTNRDGFTYRPAILTRQDNGDVAIQYNSLFRAFYKEGDGLLLKMQNVLTELRNNSDMIKTITLPAGSSFIASNTNLLHCRQQRTDPSPQPSRWLMRVSFDKFNEEQRVC